MGSRTDLSGWSDEALLELRFRDLRKLGVRLATSGVEPELERLLDELRRSGLRLRPHFWLSDEWFCPDGIPGIAVPFYLAHPRLTALEQHLMGNAEGADRAERLRILRHEAGHALENAFRLRRRADRRALFGPTSTPYPRAYLPKPYSRRYVRHLGDGYAQSHPDEDFAETFAVWLDPASGWRHRYAGTAAEAKLAFIERLSGERRDKAPAVRRRETPFALSDMGSTLRAHYARKRRRRLAAPHIDRSLARLFEPAGPERVTMTAPVFLRKIHVEVRREIALRTSEPLYAIDRVYRLLIERSRKLGLAAPSNDRRRRDLARRIVTTTQDCLESGLHRFPL